MAVTIDPEFYKPDWSAPYMVGSRIGPWIVERISKEGVWTLLHSLNHERKEVSTLSLQALHTEHTKGNHESGPETNSEVPAV